MALHKESKNKVKEIRKLLYVIAHGLHMERLLCSHPNTEGWPLRALLAHGALRLRAFRSAVSHERHGRQCNTHMLPQAGKQEWPRNHALLAHDNTG